MGTTTGRPAVHQHVRALMSPTDRLRWLMAPHRDRWKLMLAGLALCVAAVGAATLQPPKVVEAVLIVLAIAAWFVGACGMVGYVRWFFASELLRAKRDAINAVEEEKGESARSSRKRSVMSSRKK